MAEIQKKLFKGLKQVTKTYFDTIEDKNKVGYIWFVRTEADSAKVQMIPDTSTEDPNDLKGGLVVSKAQGTDTNLLNDSYDIYFGTKHYGHFMQGEIPALAEALGQINKAVGLDEKFDFVPSPEGLVSALNIKFEETIGHHTVKEAIDYLYSSFEKYQSDNDTKLLKKAVDIKYTPSSEEHPTATLQLVDGNGGLIGTEIDCTDFIADGILESATLETDPVGQSKGTYIVLKFNQKGSGKKNPIYLDVKGLIDVYKCEDGSILVDGNKLSVAKVDTNKTLTTKAITVKGGPLANLLNDKGIKQIDANTNMQALLEKLFFEELWSKSPKFSDDSTSYSVDFKDLKGISLSQSGTVEVGTTVTASAYTAVAPTHNTPKRTYSGFEYGYAETKEGPVQSGQPASVSATGFTAKKGDFKLERSFSGFERTPQTESVTNATVSNCNVAQTEPMTVKAGTNSVTYTVSGPGFTGNIPAEKGYYYHASNVGAFDEIHKIAKGGLVSLDKDPDAKSKTVSVNGVRKGFYGTSTGEIVLNSDGIRALTAFDEGGTLSMSIPNDTITVVIALPKTSWSKHQLLKVEDKNAFGTDVVGSFVLSNVLVEGANKYTAEDYNVYTFVSGKKLKENTYTVTFK